MSYIPKSKIIVKTAEPDALSDSFFTKSNPKIPYAGSYMETSDGRYFIGTSFINKGEELFKENSIEGNFGDGEDFNTYLNLKPSPYKFLNKIKPIPAFKNLPIEKDYEKGYYDRYFVSRVNQQFGYKEISPKTYKSINEKQGEYDHHLHDVGVIKWAIKGNVYKINQLSVLQKEKKFPYLGFLFPVLNEFHRPDLQVQTNLITEGGELYYKDGTEYIGAYHIHPTKGPMEGATHTPSLHARLSYTSKIKEEELEEEKQKSFNRFRKKQLLEKSSKETLAMSNADRGTPSNTPASSGRGASSGGGASSGRGASSGGGVSSGGGGGGY